MPVYDYDYQYGVQVVDSLSKAFQTIRQASGNKDFRNISIESEYFRELYKKFEKHLPGQISQLEFKALLDNALSVRLERTLQVVLAQLRNRKIVADMSRLKQDGEQSGIKVVRYVSDSDGNDRRLEEPINNFKDIVEIQDLKEQIKSEFRLLGHDFMSFEVIENFVASLVRANLDPNFSESEKR